MPTSSEPLQPKSWASTSPRDLIHRRYFPDVMLTTHDGKRVRLFDDLIRDKIAEVYPEIYSGFSEKIMNPKGFHLDVPPRRLVCAYLFLRLYSICLITGRKVR